MASVVIIVSGIAIYQFAKSRKEKKALRLEAEKETTLTTEHDRVLHQFEDDRSSVYSGNTLTNELRDEKKVTRTTTVDSGASSSKRSKLRAKLGSLSGRARADL
jgi:hypothetical protein